MKNESLIVKDWEWATVIENREQKEKMAHQVARKVNEGDVIGVGSGSTSYLALLAVADRVHMERLHIQVIPTSVEMTLFCNQLEIPVTTLSEQIPDWSFDGTDEIDSSLNLLKGRGGAMFKEKLIIRSSPKTYILADENKKVSHLGTHFPVPVEIFPMALPYVEKEINHCLPTTVFLRMAKGKDGPVITENGNLILDVWFDEIPLYLERALKSITGVVETGLFIGYKNIEWISE